MRTVNRGGYSMEDLERSSTCPICLESDFQAPHHICALYADRIKVMAQDAFKLKLNDLKKSLQDCLEEVHLRENPRELIALAEKRILNTIQNVQNWT